MNIRKAVILAAGLGTRFLPVAKSIPKVMLPVLDTPLIHYAVEEAVASGIEHVILVVSDNQKSIANYFQSSKDLEEVLENRKDSRMLDRIKSIPTPEHISYVYQNKQNGIGDALLCAKDVIGDDPFALIFPDDLIWSNHPIIGSMANLFNTLKCSVMAVREVSDDMVPNLGIVDARLVDNDLYEIHEMVEKPRLVDAPSNLSIVGRYVLSPEIFDHIQKIPAGVGGEVQLTDALSSSLATEKIYGYRFSGEHFDAGNPIGLLNASKYAASLRQDSYNHLG